MINLEDRSTQIGIVYLPEIGSYSGDKIEENNSLDSSISFNFNKDSIFSEQTNVSSTSILDQYAETLGGIKDRRQIQNAIEKAREPDEILDDDKSNNSDDISDSQQEELSENIKIASSIADYYGLLARKDFVVDELPTIIPATLSLSIYGISSLIPGDVFRIDYLPERQRELIYFQITKVSHNITSATWTTEIETVPRIRTQKKSTKGLYYKPKEIALTKSILDDLKLARIDNINGHNVKKYMRKLKIIDIPSNYSFDWMFQFEWGTAQLDLELDRLPGETHFPSTSIIEGKFLVPDISGEVSEYDKPWALDILLNSYKFSITLTEGKLYKLLVVGQEWIILPYNSSEIYVKRLSDLFIKIKKIQSTPTIEVGTGLHGF